MHEVALSRQLAAAVSRAAGSRRVRTVAVAVGELRQVVPDALTHAWGFVVRDTALAGAELQLRRVPAVIECAACATRRTLGPELGFDCRACGSPDTRVISGEEFVLTAIEVENDERGTENGTLPSA